MTPTHNDESVDAATKAEDGRMDVVNVDITDYVQRYSKQRGMNHEDIKDRPQA